MASYLSDQWFDEVASSPTAPDSWPEGPGETLVLQHAVTGGRDGDICYHVRMAGPAAAIGRGPAVDPDVTFTEDYATAAAIARGELSAPAALLAGRIRVGGNLGALIAFQDRIAVHDLIPAGVRESTTY